MAGDVLLNQGAMPGRQNGGFLKNEKIFHDD